jgi:urease accessory protein
MSAEGLPPARHHRRPPFERVPYDVVTLAHDERTLRRRRLVTVHGEGVLVDLARTVRLEHGDALELEDGRLLEVVAAEEPLLEVRGDLVRLAWHIGNRHLPCQIEGDRLLIGRDRVVRAMLLGLGASLREVSEPFVPEGGAYDSHRHEEAGLGDLGASLEPGP